MGGLSSIQILHNWFKISNNSYHPRTEVPKDGLFRFLGSETYGSRTGKKWYSSTNWCNLYRFKESLGIGHGRNFIWGTTKTDAHSFLQHVADVHWKHDKTVVRYSFKQCGPVLVVPQIKFLPCRIPNDSLNMSRTTIVPFIYNQNMSHSVLIKVNVIISCCSLSIAHCTQHAQIFASFELLIYACHIWNSMNPANFCFVCILLFKGFCFITEHV